MVSLGLIFACGGLAMLSLMLTAANSRWIAQVTGTHGWAETTLQLLVFKVAALVMSILALFLIYWLLPNRKVEPGRVVPVAIVVGLIMEALKYVNLLLWPWLQAKLDHEYRVFQHSITILLWSFVLAMVSACGRPLDRPAGPFRPPGMSGGTPGIQPFLLSRIVGGYGKPHGARRLARNPR